MKIFSNVEKKQKNFWNGCVFHPTDAVEDPWGKRILDQMAKDKAINTVRVYTMFEDIVYYDENNELQYDFRVSDLRLDYLLSKGYDILLAYAGMPDCIAAALAHKSNSGNKTRYKGKMWNTSPPKDYALWEEICYEYTKHNVERYGLDTVSKWHCQCFNESDHCGWFMLDYSDYATQTPIRCEEYCKLYEAFEKGIRRVSDLIPIGGPVMATQNRFLDGFLGLVKEKGLKLDFISFHHYGNDNSPNNDPNRPYSVKYILKKYEATMDVIRARGFADKPIFIDEWGMASGGYRNKQANPMLIARETEIMSSYFVKLIKAYISEKINIEKLMICLSGQHEMTEDFSGLRNFFTLNFIKKPIYNAHILAAKLGENILCAENSNENICVIPTKDDVGNYAVLLSYSSEYFEEDIPAIEETITFEEDIKDKQVTVWCIDKNTTNPYRLYEKLGIETPNDEQILLLRKEGKMKPIRQEEYNGSIKLKLTPNCTYLITIGEKL